LKLSHEDLYRVRQLQHQEIQEKRQFPFFACLLHVADILGRVFNRSYLLAQAQVDAGTLANNIAALNTATTFAPLQPLHDTDVAGFLRHAHEQSIISTIEEGRRETLLEFRRVLDERVRRDWEARKKKIFEELGERSTLLAPESRKGARTAANRVRS
jgi:hypothetical protein